jgi:hypothetical protein
VPAVPDAVRDGETSTESKRTGSYLVRFDDEIYWTSLALRDPTAT